ncbi:hypothetical protein N7492_003774 [Penicillium capsulatum]|uniref:Uncharacterized protein n=1 Tax=Penicillium capsulatum TaxID=69766 RepID=A0A9W9LX96_9EURO|nr:hypothetical protein N7492_003774 [Penicillium capsulatum]KAJ6121644.1 hypothetical protein N7512_004109 [Penicillium capsulatum]
MNRGEAKTAQPGYAGFDYPGMICVARRENNHLIGRGIQSARLWHSCIWSFETKTCTTGLDPEVYFDFSFHAANHLGNEQEPGPSRARVRIMDLTSAIWATKVDPRTLGMVVPTVPLR